MRLKQISKLTVLMSLLGGLLSQMAFASLDVNRQNENGDTPIISAVFENDLEQTRELLNRGANLYLAKEDGADAIDFALWSQNLDIKALILNWQNENGDTPLIKAIFSKNIERARSLLANGADLFATKKDGSSCFDFAFWSKNNGMKDLVLNWQNESGETPVIKAIFDENIDLLTKLIQYGADLSLTKKDGASAFDFAIWSNNSDILSLIIKGLEQSFTRIGRASNDHLTRIGYTRIHISGNNHRCWMRSAWFAIFNKFTNDSDRLIALLYGLQFRNEGNEGFVGSTNYVIENLETILRDPKFLLGDDGKYQGALDDHLYVITYQLLRNSEEYRLVMENSRSGTTDMMVSLGRHFDNANFYYMSVLHSEYDVFQHNGIEERQIVVLLEETRDAYPLIVYHSGGHFEIDRLLSSEERR